LMTKIMEGVTAPPEQQLMQMLTGMWTTQAVAAAARLGIPDVLHGGARSAEEVAAVVNAQPRATRRLLRALASIGVFGMVPPDRFAATPLSDRLRDTPGTMRNFFVAETDKVHWQSWHRLLDAVRSGAPQPPEAVGEPAFEYYNHHREEGEQFGRAMEDVSAMVVQGVLEHYDFSGVRTAVDVGGGNGSLLRAILQRYPSMNGIVFDLPYIGAQAQEQIAKAGLSDRCRFEAGDFFKALPSADLYLLKFILHDWDDADCVRILERCRTAANGGARVLAVEMLVPPDNSSPMVAFMDLNMLVMTGGLERTGDEYNALLQRVGVRPTRILSTGTPFSLIEGAV
jgi:hypothetical protein